MKDYYKINEIAKLYGIGVDSLRYYERLGILKPRRDTNGYRLYSLKEMYKLNMIRDLRRLNFSMEQIKADWAAFRGVPQELALPSAPKQFLHYFEEPDRPQTRLDRNLEHGMAVSLGRLREDTLFDYKFACMSHNTLRGAAGGAVLLAELLAAKGYFD